MREIPRGTASSSSAMPARFIATWYLAACDRGVASGRRDGRLSFWAEILQSRFQQAGRHAHVGAPGTRRPSFQGLADDWSACGAQFCAQFGASCGAPAPVELNQSTTNSDHVITPTTRKYTEKDKPTSPSPDRRQAPVVGASASHETTDKWRCVMKKFIAVLALLAAFGVPLAAQ